MRKLEKLTLEGLKNETPTIGNVEVISLKGGYSINQMEGMMGSGTWYGGFVDGIGYVSGTVDVYAYDVQGHLGDNDQGFIGSANGQTYEECYWETFGDAVSGIAGGLAGMVVAAADFVIATMYGSAPIQGQSILSGGDGSGYTGNGYQGCD